MQSSKPRHGSSEMAKVASPTASRSIRASPSSPDTANSKPARPFERRYSAPKAALSPEMRVMRAPEVQQQPGQVQEELRRAREEKAQALEEVKEMKQALAWRMEEGEDVGRIKMLEIEVEKAKDSERKMLESLTSQTKQLEGAKIELEEAKLEMRHLQESLRGVEGGSVSSRSDGILGRFLDKPNSSDSPHSSEDVAWLRNELRLAIEAEEKNKKAMDDLAFTLKEVTTELNQLKEMLSTTQSELDRVKAEADDSKLVLNTTEEKLQVTSEEAERLRMEADESIVAWNAKENGFINCMKVSEEEITKLKQENFRLVESQRTAREECSKLRDIMKQALNEATVVKEALEIARRENSQLKDLLSEKENSLKAIKQDYENLKVSEAAAVDSVEGLKNLLAATSGTEMRSTVPVDAGSLAKPTETANEGSETKGIEKFPAEEWRSDTNSHSENGLKDPSARSGPLLGSMSERASLSSQKDRMYASFSCVSELTASPLPELDNGDVNSDGFDHMERLHLDGMNNERGVPTKQKKKRQILRRFSDLLRRSSLHK